MFDQETLDKRKQNSYASPTPITDGERVYAVFADGSFVALDFDGNLLWKNRDFDFFSEHGLGVSPILYKNLLIMAFDPSSRTHREEKVGWKVPWDGAAIWALNKETGKLVWEGKRGPSRLAHVTPNLMEVEGKMQLVSGAGDVVQGFDPHTGDRLWSVYSQGEGVVPSIVIADGLAFSISGFEATTIRAVAPGGKIVWEQTRSASHIPSMLYHDGLLYNMQGYCYLHGGQQRRSHLASARGRLALGFSSVRRRENLFPLGRRRDDRDRNGPRIHRDCS